MVARVVGVKVSAVSAIEFGPLHYRELEKQKTEALRLSKGNFDTPMSMFDEM